LLTWRIAARIIQFPATRSHIRRCSRQSATAAIGRRSRIDELNEWKTAALAMLSAYVPVRVQAAIHQAASGILAAWNMLAQIQATPPADLGQPAGHQGPDAAGGMDEIPPEAPQLSIPALIAMYAANAEGS